MLAEFYEDYRNNYEIINGTVIDPFYLCIKHKVPADPKLDGTDYFIIAESMHFLLFEWLYNDEYHCSLSFTCENDQKAFYKLIKDC